MPGTPYYSVVGDSFLSASFQGQSGREEQAAAASRIREPQCYFRREELNDVTEFTRCSTSRILVECTEYTAMPLLHRCLTPAAPVFAGAIQNNGTQARFQMVLRLSQ